MSQLLTIWLDICLLRKGPQDLPASRVLLTLTVITYGLVSFLLSLPGYDVARALLMALTELMLLVAFAAALLFMTGKIARLNQTLTALTGTGTLLGLLALPLVTTLSPSQDAAQLSDVIGLFWLVLFAWSLLVIAHIMRHALAIAFPVAIGVSVLYTLVALQLMTNLFPLPSG